MNLMPHAVTAYIGIGSNLGDAGGNVQAALAALDKLADCELTAQSSLFCSAPIDATGDDYINAVAQLRTRLSPQMLLEQLQTIEHAFGRLRPYANAPRTLDLDILLYDQQKVASAVLQIPHPRLTQRAFTLIPLLQIDPLINIPGHGPAHHFAPDVAGQCIQKYVPSTA